MLSTALRVSLGTSLSLLLCVSSARGASFDSVGEFSFDDQALFTESFETPPPPDADAGDAGDDAGSGYVQSDTALDGSHVLELQEFQGTGLDVSLPAQSGSFGGTLWARGEVVATLEVLVGGETEDFGVFYPTGRTTSDGWMELALHDVTVDVSRADGLQVGLFAPSGAEVDAVEIVADGPAVLGATCTGASDVAACSAGQICMWGRCRNFQSRVPPLPPPAWRSQLVDYLDQRFALLYGPFANRELDLPSARVEIDAMRHATGAWDFWRHFRVSIHRLHDWHTRGSDISGYTIQNPRPIAVCFIEGDADLTQAVPSKPGWNDVLVSHVGSGPNTFGLKPGDRLVSVDGKHPIEWVRSLIGVDFDFETASNHQTHAEDAARLHRAIATFAERIEVIRCDATTKTCNQKPETIFVADVEPSGGPGTGVACDNRPINHVPGAPDSHSLGGFYSGIVNESNDTEKIYGLQWSSLLVTGGAGGVGAQLSAAVAEWRQDARGVILDHRTGFGGTTLGSALIWDFVRTPTPLDYFQFRQRSDQLPPASVAEGKALFDQLAASGYVEKAGSSNPALDIPVALLIHLDGSASDWLPLGVKGSPNARVFGPFQTAGAFSTLFSFSYWFGMGYSIAVGDTLHSSGVMLNGTGVEPDVVVTQKQSDLLAGKDSVYDAALTWVRQGLKP